MTVQHNTLNIVCLIIILIGITITIGLISENASVQNDHIVLPIDTDPMLNRMIQFIENDTTDAHEYIDDEYICVDFSSDLIANLTAAGFKAQYTWIMPCTGKSIESHMMVRCGDYIIESMNDEIMQIDEFAFRIFEKDLYMIHIDTLPEYLPEPASEPVPVPPATHKLNPPEPDPTPRYDPDLWNPPEPDFPTHQTSGYTTLEEAVFYRGDRTGIQMLDARMIVYAPLYDDNIIFIGVLTGQTLNWLESVIIEVDGVVVASYIPDIYCGSDCYASDGTSMHRRHQLGWIHLDDGIKNTGNIVAYGTFGKKGGPIDTTEPEYDQPIGKYELTHVVQYPFSASCTMH